MSKLSITQACAAAALVAMSSTAFAQENTAVNTADPALNATADPLANDTTDVLVTDPLVNDPMATTTTTTTDPLVAEPMFNETERDDDDGFPWGLLGLLGLAGLLGMRRRDDDVRVDTTRNTR